MKFLLVSILFCSQFSLIQCNSSKKNSIESNLSSNNYFPVKNNLQWKYINEGPREETEIIDTKCRNLGDETRFEFDKFPFFGNTDSKVEIDIDKQGNVYVKDPAGNSNLLIPPENKFANGYSWKYNELLYGFLTKTPVKVKTEAGTYNCIYIIFTDGFTFSYEMWLAKDTGIVKWGANRTNPPTLNPLYYVLKEFKE